MTVLTTVVSMTSLRRFQRCALAVGSAGLLALSVAHAEINSVTGGIVGINNGTLVNGDGTGDASIEISGVSLALTKQARDLSGAVLADGTSVSPGQTLYFVLHVDNTTLFMAGDVRMVDLIDESQFTYVPGTLEVTSVASGSDDAAIWAGIWLPQTDGSGDDEASVSDSGGPAGLDRVTIGAVPIQLNQNVDIAGSSLRAYRFQAMVN